MKKLNSLKHRDRSQITRLKLQKSILEFSQLCEISSELCILKIIKLGSFLTKLFKKIKRMKFLYNHIG